MFTLFVIGNLASGKSTATRYLASRGARRIDLDQLAKDLYVPGSDVVAALADAFGSDILDENGAVRPRVLAERAFATPEQTRALNDIVLPLVYERLNNMLLPCACMATERSLPALTVVEVSLAREFSYAFPLADEIMAITAPLEVRIARAVERGMSEDDAENRAALQPSEEELCGLANTVFDNTAGDDSLFLALDEWLACHGFDNRQMALESLDA
ncbi:dephospho-CoA kinase [Collinsella sp. An7]|uniref:dephospho-CoA kinase n=1 Tax=Collinsella sp. An7 TaxID=1965651 RepID=UPI000B39C487|nr:dephospho-CoA kinase [Collinsella sp. An7]OUN46874.1 dephospho-CoA kinase [Collinsella sp. An7]